MAYAKATHGVAHDIDPLGIHRQRLQERPYQRDRLLARLVCPTPAGAAERLVVGGRGVGTRGGRGVCEETRAGAARSSVPMRTTRMRCAFMVFCRGGDWLGLDAVGGRLTLASLSHESL